MNKTAVVILNYNGEKLLQQFLPSVLQHSSTAQVVVADNGSTDQSINILKTQFPSVRLIALDANYGFCGGYNRALKQVEAEYHVLLNSDVEVTAGWLKPLEEILDKDSSVAAVQPKILSYQEKNHFEYAGAGGGFLDSFGYPFCRGRLFDYTEVDDGQYNDAREIFWASGACMIIRSALYHKLGGLDEDFFAHMEEIDLCWRIQRASSRVYYTGASTVYHLGGATLSKSNPRKTYFNFRNGLILLYKHLSPLALTFKLPIRLLLDYVAAFRFVLAGSTADAGAVFRAHLDFLKSIKVSSDKRKMLKIFPFKNENVYQGLVLWQYFGLGRKKIRI